MNTQLILSRIALAIAFIAGPAACVATYDDAELLDNTESHLLASAEAKRSSCDRDGENCCAGYHACIDSCAKEYTGDAEACDNLYEDGSRRHEGCMGLADSKHEQCLTDCGPRPPGC